MKKIIQGNINLSNSVSKMGSEKQQLDFTTWIPPVTFDKGDVRDYRGSGGNRREK